MSELSVKGKVTKILPEETGTSKAGKEWKKQEFVIKTDDQYPKDVCFTLFGDKTDLLSKVSVDNEVSVSFNVESREYNGKWFHNINAWKILVNENKIEETADLPESDITGDDDPPF
jgi:hypothetical protein